MLARLEHHLALPLGRQRRLDGPEHVRGESDNSAMSGRE